MFKSRKIGFTDIVNTMDGDSLQADIPPYWMQGRTVYGGLTSGLALAAAKKAFEGLPPLRSVLVNFTGPVGNAPVFLPTLLRRGKNMTSVAVDVHSTGKLAARIVFSFGVARESKLSVPANLASAIKGPDEYPRFTPKLAEPVVPKFFLNFDTRLVAGARPMAGAKEGYIQTWSRHKDAGSRQGEASLVAIADVLPPAVLPMARSFGPVSSVNWMLNIVTDQLQTEDGWWLLDTKLTQSDNGYSSQVMKIWNRQGRLVAEGMQSVAIFF